MKNIFLSAFILLSFYTASAQSGWTQVAGLGISAGTARAATFSIPSRGKGYVVGGGNSWYVSDAWAYDTASNAWSQVANYPGINTDGMAGFAIDTFGYVGLGGYAGYSYSNSFYRYNAAANSWMQVANFPGAARVDGIAFVVNGLAYVGAGINGSNNNMLSDFYSYNVNTNTWSQITPYPGAGHFFLAPFSTTNKGYVGTGAKLGVSPNTQIPVQDFWEYDPTVGVGGTWTRKADFAGGPRGGAIGVSFGNNGYIGTGFSDSTATNLTTDFWKYNPAKDSWTRIADFSGVARSFGAGFSFISCAYAGTGYTSGTAFPVDFWKLLDVNPSAYAAFSASQTGVCRGGSVTFTDTSNINPTIWVWNFPGGNPAISFEQNPVINYPAAGQYDVMLTVSNGTDTLSITKTAYINVVTNAPLTATANPSIICAGQSTTLSVSGGAGSYSWSPAIGLSDSTSSTVAASPTVTTTYTISFSNGGCSSSGLVIVTVGNTAVGGIITAINDTVCVGTGTLLTLTGSSALPIQWQSSLDGVNFTDIVGASDTILNTGPLQQTTEYSVIVGTGNCSASSDSFEIYVPIPLSASFNPVIAGQRVTFNSNISRPPKFYSWNFGDGNSSTDASPIHIYAITGNYHVCLTVTDFSNCAIITHCRDVSVGSAPHCSAYFVLLADSTTPHHWFAINETNGKAPITYSWQWGDGASGTGDTASHIYASAGYYNICLTITDDSACTSTYCDSSAYLYRMDGSSTMVSVNVVNSIATTTTIVNVPANNLLVFPNPCSICGVKGIDNINDMVATDMLGRKIDVQFSKASGGYNISFPSNQTGMFLLHNIKTGQVVKFVRE